MLSKKELSLKELEKVAGGLADKEFWQWLGRNEKAFFDRMDKLSDEQGSKVLEIVYNEDHDYTLAEIKVKFKEIGFDCDDLM